MKEKEVEWWYCNMNGIMVYNQMCFDCCEDDEINDCEDRRLKPMKHNAGVSVGCR